MNKQQIRWLIKDFGIAVSELEKVKNCRTRNEDRFWMAPEFIREHPELDKIMPRLRKRLDAIKQYTAEGEGRPKR